VADNEVVIYLPDGYDTSELHYPVVYLLHGNGAAPSTFISGDGKAVPSLAELIANNRIEPLILVMPRLDRNADNARSPVHERYLAEEVVPLVDANYRTIPTRGARAIAGHSRGGSDTFYMAMTYPDMFSLAGMYSSGFDSPVPPERLIMAHKQHLLPLRFWISVGRNDRFGFVSVLRPFVQMLASIHFPHVYTEDDGNHRNISAHVRQSLIFFSRRLWDDVHTTEHNLDTITRTFSTVAGGPALPLDIAVDLRTPIENPAPALQLDLSILGETDLLVMAYEGNGRYRARPQITPPRKAGTYLLPVRRRIGAAEREFLCYMRLQVYPTEGRSLFADGPGREWEAMQQVTLDPEATTEVLEGSKSLGVQASFGFAFGWVPPEPVPGFGYQMLHFAFHPGSVASGSAFNVNLKGESTVQTVNLLGGDEGGVSVEVTQKAWQVVEIPLDLIEPILSIEFSGLMGGTFYLDDVRLVPRAPPLTAHPAQTFAPAIRFVRGTEEFSAVAGHVPSSLPIEVILETSPEAKPSLSLDGTAVGLVTPLPLTDQGAGRYTGWLPMDETLDNGGYVVPVTVETDLRGSELFVPIRLSIFPAHDRTIYADTVTAELDEIRQVTLDQQSTTQVFEGTTSLGVQAEVGSIFGWVPAEATPGFGYRLHLAFHPGDATGGSYIITIKGSSSTVLQRIELVGNVTAQSLDLKLENRSWQVVDVPLDLLFPNEPIRIIEFSGLLQGTFYLDDILLVPESPPMNTAVVEARQGRQPTTFDLQQSFPNPFNGYTIIRFALPQSEIVALAVFNLAGQKVATLVDGTRAAGSHTVRWDGRDDYERQLASGVYLYRMQAGTQVATHKALLLR
jgi:pimeloyl-ACP methyl ester carboxylesterase